MGLTDKFRINELTQKGSNVERRTSAGNILVKKVDGKEVKPTNKKLEKPFGQEVIKGKNKEARFKFELNESDNTPNIEQTSFSGESTGYVEKPKYNESELKKAVDVKVDELIKQKKSKRGPYILKSKYDDLRKKYEDALAQIADLRKQLNTALAEISRLEGVIEQLKVEADSAKLQQAAAENQLQAANSRYITLLSDFQQAVIKGTKEAIERVSLEAQVRGLQAQKETLVRLEEQEEATQATVAALTIQGLPGGYGQTRDSGWKVPEDAVTQPAEMAAQGAITFKSYRSNSGWPNGQTMNIYNLTEEPLDWSLTVAPKGNDSKYTGSPVFAFSPVTGTIAARSGETPGVATLTASKVRNLEGRKYGGREKWFTDTLKLTIGLDVFDIPIGFYRKVKNGGKGNS